MDIKRQIFERDKRIHARAKREWAKRDLRKWAMLAMLADEADTIRGIG